MNVIGKATLEVHRAGSGHALEFQQQVAEWAREQLLPELDLSLAELDAGDEVIVFDRIEIEVDQSNPEQWDSLVPKICFEFRKLVEAKMLESSSDEVRRMSAVRRFYEKLDYYLRHGVLPWSLSATSGIEVERQIEQWMRSSESQSFHGSLRQVLQQRTAARRLRSVLSQNSLRVTLEAIYGVAEMRWRNWDRDIATLVRQAEVQNAPAKSIAIERRAIMSRFQDRLAFELNRGGSESPSIREAVIARVVAEIFEAVPRERAELSTQSTVVTFESPEFQLASQRQLGTTELEVIARDEIAPISPLSLGDDVDVRLTEASVEPIDTESDDDIRREGIYIDHAGLILLAPYLRAFLERLELARDDQLLQAEKAIVALHYLAVGDSDSQSSASDEYLPEFQLVLPKVLCGWGLEKPLSLSPSLAPSVKDESEALLSSVIGHWSILQNTSVAGLREAFLQRPGKLTLTARNEWSLQVEQRAYDMLLQHLPWSFSCFRLPWMDRLLWTEWAG